MTSPKMAPAFYAMTGMGFMFFVAGVYLAIWPERASMFFDQGIARMLGGAMAFMGIADIAIAKIKFGKKAD